jgi:hypothetical protein
MMDDSRFTTTTFLTAYAANQAPSAIVKKEILADVQTDLSQIQIQQILAALLSLTIVPKAKF